MTDQKPQNPQQNGDANIAPIQVFAQYIKDLSFENPNSPESLLSNWGAPETQVQVNIQYRPLKDAQGTDNAFEVALMFRIEAQNKEHKKTAFIVELAYAASLAIASHVPKENIEPILMVEIPKLMFPFAREIIAKASIQGGYPPLYIQPINFEAVYIQRLQQQKAEAGEDSGEKTVTEKDKKAKA
jgi:preprotein translocase subunit SecB